MLLYFARHGSWFFPTLPYKQCFCIEVHNSEMYEHRASGINSFGFSDFTHTSPACVLTLRGDNPLSQLPLSIFTEESTSLPPENLELFFFLFILRHSCSFPDLSLPFFQLFFDSVWQFRDQLRFRSIHFPSSFAFYFSFLPSSFLFFFLTFLLFIQLILASFYPTPFGKFVEWWRPVTRKREKRETCSWSDLHT